MAMNSHNEVENIFRYLPLNPKDLHWGLYLTGIGQAFIPRGCAYPPPGHPEVYDFSWQSGRVLPEYQVVFISEGQGQFESAATGHIQIGRHDSILLFPGQWHRYRPDPQTGWREHWISFNGDYVWRLQKHRILSPARAVLHVQQADLLLETHHRIWQQVSSQPLDNSFLLSAMAMEILALTLNEIPSRTDEESIPGCSDSLVSEALRLIWNHSYRDISVQDLARELSTTRRTLERRFAQHLNATVAGEITRSRIARARHLLVHTTLPVEHIALAVGFSGADRLSKVFRAGEKISPLAYRKKHNRK